MLQLWGRGLLGELLTHTYNDFPYRRNTSSKPIIPFSMWMWVDNRSLCWYYVYTPQ